MNLPPGVELVAGVFFLTSLTSLVVQLAPQNQKAREKLAVSTEQRPKEFG
jgi:hypothetical protein